MINVIIADDEEIFREGIKYILERQDDIEVIGEASTGKEVLSLCSSLSPDLVLMDIVMPESDGIEAARALKEKYSHIKILMLTTFIDEEKISRAINFGADGYILKDVCSQDLVMAIKSCYKGFNIIQNDVFSSIAKCVGESEKVSIIKKELANTLPLTDKEHELIKYIVDGKDNKEIASLLFITEGTVRNSVSKLLKKFNLKDRIQLAVFCIKNNFV